LCKGTWNGLHGNQACAKDTLQFTCENKTKHNAQLIELGGGDRGSKDNYKRQINNNVKK